MTASGRTARPLPPGSAPNAARCWSSRSTMPGIIAGQGTAGLEIAEDAVRFGAAIDEVLAPRSGGGLVSGIALALTGAGANAKVHSVEPENP